MAEKPSYEELEKRVHELEQSESEHRKAETSLRESTNNFNNLYTQTPAMLHSIDSKGKLVNVSDYWLEKLGYSRGEVIGRKSTDFLTEKSREYAEAVILPDFFKKGYCKDIPYEFVKKNNEIINILLSSSSLKDKDGNIVMSLATLEDVTERKQAENDLRESEEKYRKLIHKMQAAVIVHDTDSRIIVCNAKAQDLLGLTEDQMLGKTAMDSDWKFLKGDGEIMSVEENPVIQVLTTRKPLRDLTACINRPKTVDQVWVTVNADPAFDSKGNIQQVVVTFMDITELKRSEANLKKSQAFLNTTGRMAKVGGWELDLNSLEVLWTEETARIHEVPLSYVPPLDEAIKFYPPEERPGLEEAIERAIAYGEPYDREMRFNTATGKHLWVHAICNPQVVDGKTVKLIGTFQDITARKRDQKDRLRLESQLRQAAKIEAVGTLAGGIAHDFNNILGIVIGNTELAMDDVPEWNPARTNLNEIKTASLRARDVVRQLLSFSRKSEQKQRPIKISTVVKESVKLLRASIPTTIEFRSNISADHKPIMADSTQIHQVIINLCTNAAHAMEESSGILELSLAEVELNEEATANYNQINPGRYVQLTVSDTGSGIDHEIMDRIFDPYFTTKEVDKGTGIGLSVVNGIVKNHDGAISVHSEPNKGTTVKVLFPVIDEKPVQEKAISEVLPQGNEHVLFIDDEKALVKMGRQVLERLGYQVEVSTNPVEALEQFRSNPNRFDLVITDMTMPQMTGDNLVKEILNIRPDMLIILCTGYSEKIDKVSAEEIGIRKYIEKPLNKRELSIAIRELLDDQNDGFQQSKSSG